MAPMKPERRDADPDLAGSLSLAQLARRWHTSQKQIRRLLGQEQLGFIQVRGHFRVPRAEVERYEQK